MLDTKWQQAVLLTAGRLGFDYACLLAALRATGADPRPSLVLLAYSAANIVALLPLTPGGLGIVEASLSGLLILAGVRPGYAFLATLAYRVASYWLPLLAGPPAYHAAGVGGQGWHCSRRCPQRPTRSRVTSRPARSTSACAGASRASS